MHLMALAGHGFRELGPTSTADPLVRWEGVADDQKDLFAGHGPKVAWAVLVRVDDPQPDEHRCDDRAGQRSEQQRWMRSVFPVARAQAVEEHELPPTIRAQPSSLQALPIHSQSPTMFARPREAPLEHAT